MFDVRHWLNRRSEQRGSRLLEIPLCGYLRSEFGDRTPQPRNLFRRVGRWLIGVGGNANLWWGIRQRHGGRGNGRSKMSVTHWRIITGAGFLHHSPICHPRRNEARGSSSLTVIHCRGDDSQIRWLDTGLMGSRSTAGVTGRPARRCFGWRRSSLADQGGCRHKVNKSNLGERHLRRESRRSLP